MTERFPEVVIQKGSQEEVSGAIENDLESLGKVSTVVLCLNVTDCVI